MAPFLFTLAFEALSVYELLKLLFFSSLAIEPSVCALPWFGTIRRELDDFEAFWQSCLVFHGEGMNEGIVGHRYPRSLGLCQLTKRQHG